jgi:hypothetical protein
MTARGFSYYSFLAVSVVAVCVAGYDYVGRVRAGQGGSQTALSDLLWIFGIAIGVLFLRRKFRQRQTSPGTVDSSSFSRTLKTLPYDVRAAFAHRPIFASFLTLFVIAIPIGMVRLATPGGFRGFGSDRWLLVGVVETPVVLITVLVALSFARRRS